jgi:hypothetical protein
MGTWRQTWLEAGRLSPGSTGRSGGRSPPQVWEHPPVKRAATRVRLARRFFIDSPFRRVVAALPFAAGADF